MALLHKCKFNYDITKILDQAQSWDEIKNYLSSSFSSSIICCGPEIGLQSEQDKENENCRYTKYKKFCELWQRIETKIKNQKSKYTYTFMEVSGSTTNHEWIIVKQDVNVDNRYYLRDTLIHFPTMSDNMEILSMESEHDNFSDGKNRGQMIKLLDWHVDTSFNLPCIQYVNFVSPNFRWKKVDRNYQICFFNGHDKYLFLLSSRRTDEIAKILWPYCFLPAVIIRIVLEYGWATIINT